MHLLTLADSIKVTEDVVHRIVGDEAVILNLKSGLYYGLDAVGSRIWKILAEQESLKAVFDTLLREYDATPEELEFDILRIVGEMQQKGLVEINHTP